jgi:hypothetical protein
MPVRSKAPHRPVEPITEVERAVRATVRAGAPGLHVEIKWASEWQVGRDLVLAVFAFTQHVGVEFWRGTSLPDPDHLLEGTGRTCDTRRSERSLPRGRPPCYGSSAPR